MTIALFEGPRVLWKDAVQNKFFDSLAAGKPVACNFLGFQSEIAVEHDVGLIIDRADAGYAAAQLLEKLRNVEWMDGVSSRAGFLAKGRFNRDQLAGDLAKVLTDAVRDSDQSA
jgi:glycosyltransferase involved in cell wall biosynthesis